MSWSSGGGRLVLTVNGVAYALWQTARITRDLREITGTFRLDYFDAGRAAAAMPAAPRSSPVPAPILRRQSCTVALDGQVVLDGWIDGMEGEWTATSIKAIITGHDKTVDLSECSACAKGPAEWRGATLLQIAQQVCSPFGISVRADTNIGAPFVRLAVNPHETALSLLEKAARQRGVLVVSDGVGGLLLTTGGRQRAPADIRAGSNAQRLRYKFDDRHRFSDIYVKGQSEKAAGLRADISGPPMGHDYVPGPQPSMVGAQQIEAAGILMTGHAVDPEVKRWRPSVRMTRTQSGSATQQQQAEWAVRVARGESTNLTYTVLDWRANGQLWLPNTVVRVWDPYAGVDDDMLIRTVDYLIGPDGEKPTTPQTEIQVVGLTAFDRIDLPTPKRPLKVG